MKRAIAFYDLEHFSQRKLTKLQQDIKYLTETASTKSKFKIEKLESEQREYLQELRFERHHRAQHLQSICREIIELCEGDNFTETNRKSAQLLGTIQLLAPTEGSKVAAVNERSKPLYKSILALRLLDEVCVKKLLPNRYLEQELAELSTFNYKELRIESEAAYRKFVDNIKVPVLMAAILQDIGNYHPDAQQIMYGVDGKQDCYRTLNVEERKSLLQINYRETLKYLLNGIGISMYLGNSKTERESSIK